MVLRRTAPLRKFFPTVDFLCLVPFRLIFRPVATPTRRGSDSHALAQLVFVQVTSKA